MTDREKIIKGLQEIVNSDWMWKKADYWAMICKNALALLKAQEPVKPIRLENWWKCPSCSGNIVANMNYCPRCGKAVKWDD